MTTDDLLGKVFDGKVMLGNTVTGIVQFTVQEIDPTRDKLVVVDNASLQRQTWPLGKFLTALQTTDTYEEVPVAPYGRA